MHDFSSNNVTEDPIKIPGQLNEVLPLTPVQIFVKEEEFVYCNTEEPELVPLLPVLPKEGHVENSLEEWSNQSDPLALEQSVANASYVEYVENSEPILMELEATSTEGSSYSLRISQESESTVENGEVYDLTGSHKVVPVSENSEASLDSECIEIMDASRVPLKVFHCGFRAESEVQVHTLSHAARGGAVVCRDVPRAELMPKRIRTLKAQHACGDCGESFERLEHLMRHRLRHIRAALSKPELSTMPEQQVSATPDSRHMAATISVKTAPTKSPQRAATTPQPKKWVRRKKARLRRVS